MYHISYKSIATQEYQDAINWYALRSRSAAEKFIAAVNEKLDLISLNPKQYRNLHKGFYEVSTRKYPYTIVYFIEENVQQVIIISIYHHKRSPKKKYNR